MNKFSWIASVCLLSACSVGPDYERPDFYQDKDIANSLNMAEKSSLAVRPDWHEDFKDPVLNRLVHLSLTRNLDIKSAVQKLRAARENLYIAKVAYLPSLSVQGSHTKTKPSQNNPLSFREDYYTMGLDASWEIDIWGAGRRRTEQARALYEAYAADVENVLVSVKAETVSLYFSLRSVQERINVIRQSITLQEAIFELTSTLYDSGLTSAADLNQAQFALENLKASLPDLQNAQREYSNALTLLTGRLPDSLNSLLKADKDNSFHKEFMFDFDLLYKLPVNTIRSRPDVRSAERMLAAQNAVVGQAVASLYPNVSVSALLGLQSVSFRKLFFDNSQTYSVVPSVSAPLFRWGALIANIRAQKAIKEQSVLNYQNALLAAITDVKNNVNALKANQEKMNYIGQGLQNIQSVVYLNFVRYQSGLIELNTLLNQTQSLLQTQNDFIAAKQAVYLNIVGFYKSLGV